MATNTIATNIDTIMNECGLTIPDINNLIISYTFDCVECMDDLLLHDMLLKGITQVGFRERVYTCCYACEDPQHMCKSCWDRGVWTFLSKGQLCGTCNNKD